MKTPATETRVVAAVDFSSVTPRVLEEAAREARQRGSILVVLHVRPVSIVEHAPYRKPSQEFQDSVTATEEELDALAAPLRAPDLEVETRLVGGEPGPEILREVDRGDIVCLVLGTHGRKGIGRLVLGSVAEWVVRRSEIPVLLVRPSRAAAQELTGSG